MIYPTIPARWTSILKSIQEVTPSAHIAGGAIRDLINDKPIKDVDIFVPAEAPSGHLDSALDRHGLLFVREVPHPYFTHSPVVDSSLEYTDGDYYSYETLAVNIIRLNQPKLNVIDNLNAFDFGICRAGYDGNEVFITDAFKHDLARKQFTLLHCNTEEQFANSMRRYARLKEKYADWPLIVAEHLEGNL